MTMQAVAHSSPHAHGAAISRRAVLATFSGMALPRVFGAAQGEFRGIYPIVATPYQDDGSVDLATLAEEVRFLDRAGVHGIVWPQLASEYALLTYDERIAGAETIVKASDRKSVV